jgi:hypothetical protein
MIDLIVRLRNWERVYSCDEGKPDGSLYLEAADRIEELEAKLEALVDGLRGKIDLFENRRNTATNADSKSLWHIVSNELSALLGDEV